MPHTENPELLDEIRALAEQLDLGPVADVRPLGADGTALQVELDEQAAASTLLAWASLLTVVDMTVGQYDASDPYVRVHLRGTNSELGALVVTLPMHRVQRATQAELAWENAGLGPFALLRKLTAAE